MEKDMKLFKTKFFSFIILKFLSKSIYPVKNDNHTIGPWVLVTNPGSKNTKINKIKLFFSFKWFLNLSNVRMMIGKNWKKNGELNDST